MKFNNIKRILKNIDENLGEDYIEFLKVINFNILSSKHIFFDKKYKELSENKKLAYILFSSFWVSNQNFFAWQEWENEEKQDNVWDRYIHKKVLKWADDFLKHFSFKETLYLIMIKNNGGLAYLELMKEEGK